MTSTTEVIASARASADDPRIVEGIAVPYGQIAANTPIGPEAFAPGAFRESAEKWQTRSDGARLPFRAAHKEKPIGSIIELRDTPDGLMFRARVRPGPAGDAYLADLEDGLNGVSIEFAAPAPGRARNGVTIHRQAQLYGLAGSVTPAYDGARIALRDMEEDDVSETPEITPATRSEERADVAQLLSGTSIRVTANPDIYGRDALHSGTDDRGRRFSLLSDGYLAKQGNREAAERQFRWEQQRAEFEIAAERAGDVLSSEIPGAYPNDYIPGLLTPRILKGRPMGDFFNRYPISDGLPKIFAQVTTSTSADAQSAEGANPAASDFATTAVTVTPALYGAELVVSRQVLDGSSPSAEAMIMQDMFEAYAQKTEAIIKTAVEAGSAASGTAITKATPFAGTLGNVIAYYAARFRSAGAQFVPSALYAVLLSQLDSAGRPILPFQGVINSSGATNVGGSSAGILGASTFLSHASTADVVVTAAANDFAIFESPVARFSYDAVTGPSGVRIGIWGYLGVGKRLGSLKVTAA